MNNIEIRKLLLEHGIRNYTLAEWLKISEWTLSRRMRKEFSDEDRNNIIEVIKSHLLGE